MMEEVFNAVQAMYGMEEEMDSKLWELVEKFRDRRDNILADRDRLQRLKSCKIDKQAIEENVENEFAPLRKKIEDMRRENSEIDMKIQEKKEEIAAIKEKGNELDKEIRRKVAYLAHMKELLESAKTA